MSPVDWSELGNSKRGLVVEGQSDQLVIEAFLNAGERAAQWSGWESKLLVRVAGGSDSLLKELRRSDVPGEVWGLMDKDWRTDDELSAYQDKYPRLLILPRKTIENYCIDPDDIFALLPARLRTDKPALERMQAEIARWLPHGLFHGALASVLHRRNAHQFCRSTETGFPHSLLSSVKLTHEGIEAKLTDLYNQLDPSVIMAECQKTLKAMQNYAAAEQFRRCIDGKLFFDQVIQASLLSEWGKTPSGQEWLVDLFTVGQPESCPEDLVPLLLQLVQ